MFSPFPVWRVGYIRTVVLIASALAVVLLYLSKAACVLWSEMTAAQETIVSTIEPLCLFYKPTINKLV